mgnify:CR=1 FL=1
MSVSNNDTYCGVNAKGFHLLLYLISLRTLLLSCLDTHLHLIFCTIRKLMLKAIVYKMYWKHTVWARNSSKHYQMKQEIEHFTFTALPLSNSSLKLQSIMTAKHNYITKKLSSSHGKRKLIQTYFLQVDKMFSLSSCASIEFYELREHVLQNSPMIYSQAIRCFYIELMTAVVVNWTLNRYMALQNQILLFNG